MPGRLDRLLAGSDRVAPRLSCCRPYRAPFPGGLAWAHSRWCKGPRKGQKLTEEELAELAVVRSGSGTPVLTPAQADRLQPKGATALLCWLSHPDGCTCYGCRYTNEHID